MASDQDSPKIVVVTGDVTMDWNLARPRSFPNTGQTWNTEDEIRGYWLRGGAALLAGVIRKVAAQLSIENPKNSYEVHPLIESKDRVSPYDPQHHHSYALWSLFKYEEKQDDDDEQIYVWRVKEFLGLQRPEPAGAFAADEWKQLAEEVKRANIVVLDDAGLGFRDHPEIWQDALSANERSPWIILKMARPVAQGPLWEHLSQRCPSRLIVVIPINDLRLTEAQISRELSWERTAQDLAWELVYNPDLASLSRCAHVVVSLDGAGAVTLSTEQANANTPANRECTLFFRPEVIEAMWAQKYPGGMIGYTSCLVAGLARELMLNLEQPNFPQAIQNGIAAMEVLHKEGYGKRKGDQNSQPVPFQFPCDLIVEELGKKASGLTTIPVPDPGRFLIDSREHAKAIVPTMWTILQDQCDKDDQPANHRYAIADQIVRRGVKPSLQDVPLGQFGNLVTVDRQEIESFRSVRALISEYDRQERQERPLSIAVFGAPGSGKSFGVTEVAKSVLPNRIEKLTFNISQFNEPRELLAALHKVRDVALSGKVPLVFWDEFDTSLNEQPLGWLRYFLSPMQDGSFQEGQVTHPIGRSIFVFAGGTSERREDFGKKLSLEEQDTAKVRDFVSRLKGYLDILGPNPSDGDSQRDPDCVIRRAILLRSFLEDKALQLFRPRDRKGEVDIDPGVLRAFLKIQKYEHGARSIESIVAMSLLAGKNRFERSSLPSQEQLDLHVNGQAFLALVQQMTFDKKGVLLEKLAAVNHQIYCAKVQEDGSAEPHGGKSYAELSDDIKEQNRDAVRDISTKLDLTGYVMIPARVSDRLFSFPLADVELLAEHEHVRWMELKVKDGWSYGVPRNDDAKRHPDLLPWFSKLVDEEPKIHYSPAVWKAIGDDALSETAKEKDRMSVRGIPNILAQAGFTIVKVQVENEGDNNKSQDPALPKTSEGEVSPKLRD